MDLDKDVEAKYMISLSCMVGNNLADYLDRIDIPLAKIPRDTLLRDVAQFARYNKISRCFSTLEERCLYRAGSRRI